MGSIAWLVSILFCTSSLASAREFEIYLMEVPPLTINNPIKRGIVGDVVEEAFRRAGYQSRFTSFPSPRALAHAAASVDTFIIPLARIPKRENEFTWVAYIMKVERAFFSMNGKVESFDEAKQKFDHIAVSRGSAGYHILIEQGFPLQKIIEVNQGNTAIKMLLGSRVDAWYNPVMEAEWIMKDLAAKKPQMSKYLGSTDQYLSCSKTCNPDVVMSLNQIVKEMERDGSIKKVIASYTTK